MQYDAGFDISLNKIYSIRCFYVLLVVLTGIFLRVYHIDSYDYSVDQIMHIQIAEGKDLNEVWQFSKNETHPPLGHFLRYFWMKISDNPVWVRMLSVIPDIVLMVMFFLLGNRLYPHAGIVAATLAALSPAFISLAQVVRNYSFLSLFFMCCLYGLFRFLEKKELKWLAFYTFFGLLTVSTHFGAVIPIFAITLAALPQFYKEKKNFCLWVVANALIGGVFLFFYWVEQWPPLSKVYNFPLPFQQKLVFLGDAISSMIHFPYDMLVEVPGQSRDYIVAACFILMVVSAKQIRVTAPVLFRIMVCVLLLYIILCTLSLYDSSCYRRSIWIAPFVILPISIFLTSLYAVAAVPVKLKRYGLLCLTIAIGSYAAWGVNSFAFSQEKVSKDDRIALTNFFLTHVKTNDVVVGGKVSMLAFYYHVLHDNYYRHMPVLNTKSFYMTRNIDIRNIVVNKVALEKVSFISTPYYYVMFPAERFMALFTHIVERKWLDNAGSVWFYSTVNAEELIAMKLMQCPGLSVEMTNKFVTEDPAVFVYSLPKATLINDVVFPGGKYHHCLF